MAEQFTNPVAQRIWEEMNQEHINLSSPMLNRVSEFLTSKVGQRITKEDFRTVYTMTLEETSCGDAEVDWDYFEKDWAYMQTGDLASYDDY